MLMTGNPTPDLEVEVDMLNGRGRIASVTANALDVGRSPVAQ